MKDNYRNKYSGAVKMTVHLSSTNSAFLINLANQAQTLPHVYLDELIESALMDKRDPDLNPNMYQRMAVESEVTASGMVLEEVDA